MANSWILGASLFGMKISLAGRPATRPARKSKAQLKVEGRALDYHFTSDPFEAVKDADIVYTDVWTSMGQEDEEAQRVSDLKPYAVDGENSLLRRSPMRCSCTASGARRRGSGAGCAR